MKVAPAVTFLTSSASGDRLLVSGGRVAGQKLATFRLASSERTGCSSPSGSLLRRISSGAGMATLPVLAYSTVNELTLVRVGAPGMLMRVSSRAGSSGSVRNAPGSVKLTGPRSTATSNASGCGAPARSNVAVTCVAESISTFVGWIVVAPPTSLTAVPGWNPPPVSVMVIVLSTP